MANGKMAAFGGAGFIACLALIGVASWFQSKGLYPASAAVGLTEYFLVFGALGAMCFVIFLIGLLSKSSA